MNHDESAIRTSRLGEISSGAMYRLAIGLVCCLLMTSVGLTLADADTTAEAPEAVETPSETGHQSEEETRDEQSAEEDLEDYGLFVEKVVVTAQRREEELQKVPMTITSLGEQELEKAAIRNTFELQRRTPALVVTHNGLLAEPFIRGIGTDSYASVGGDPSVAFYVDGVYQPRQVGATVDFYDVERVEVLKGPQGTLYGRNATGGLINVVPKPPVPDFRTEVELVGGDYDQRAIRGFVNVPTKQERTMFRLSFLRSEHDGYMDNLYDGSELADEDLWAGRAQLRFLSANHKIDAVVSANYSTEDSSRGFALSVDPDYPSPAVDLFGGTVPEDPREVFFNRPVFEELEKWGVHARVVYHQDKYSLLSLTAYRSSDLYAAADLDGTEVDFAFNDATDDSDAFSQEFVLSSRDTRDYEWLVGLSYLHEDASATNDVRLPPFEYRGLTLADKSTDAWGIFGHGSYYWTQKLRGIAGLRYSYETKHHELNDVLNGQEVGASDDKDSWGALTPRLGLEYHHNDVTMSYFTVARGFKSGGFNSGQLQEDSFDPEYVWNYELGVKPAAKENRVLASASAFFSEFSDIQVFRQDPTPGAFPEVVNAAEAKIKGIETELFYRPSGRLSFRMGIAYLDAELTEFVSIDENDPTGDPDQSGNPMTRAPEWSGNASVEYVFPVGDVGFLTAYVGYGFQSEVYFDYFKNPAVRQPAYGVWDTELRYESPARKWYLALYGANLSDELYAQAIFSKNELIGTLRIWAPPRTFGLRAGFRL